MQVMISALTPDLSKHSQVAHFYNKLAQTDPTARDRAAINHAVAAMVKKRQDDEDFKRLEGQPLLCQILSLRSVFCSLLTIL